MAVQREGCDAEVSNGDIPEHQECLRENYNTGPNLGTGVPFRLCGRQATKPLKRSEKK